MKKIPLTKQLELVWHVPFSAPRVEGAPVPNPTPAQRAANGGWLPLRPKRRDRYLPPAPRQDLEVLRDTQGETGLMSQGPSRFVPDPWSNHVPRGMGRTGPLKANRPPLDPAKVELRDLLQAGAQGRVYSGYYAGKPCVVKVPKRGNVDMQREARANEQVLARSGPHRNLAPYFGRVTLTVEGHDELGLVFGHVNGKGGSRFLQRETDAYQRGRVSRAQRDAIARLVVSRMRSAAMHCNAAGVVHCDLKIHNIIFERETGEPVLIDFGCAQFKSDPPSNDWPDAMRGLGFPFSRNYMNDAKLLAALAGSLSEVGGDADGAGPAHWLRQATRPGHALHDDARRYFWHGQYDEAATLELIRTIIDSPQYRSETSESSIDLFE